MYNFNTLIFNKIKLINFFIAILPLTMILGNLAININLIIICLLGIITYGKNILIINNKIIQHLIYAFFTLIILTTILNNWKLATNDEIYKIHLFKSLAYLRFLLFFLIINKLIEQKQFDINLFFISCGFFSFFVSIDILIQYIFSKNILGYHLIGGTRASGVFKEELIAGGYIQRFSLFFIFFVLIKDKYKKYFNIKLILLFTIFLITILFTLNRMPLIIFLMSFLLYFLINKKIKEIIIIFILTLSLLFSIFVSSSEKNRRIQADLTNFVQQSNKIILDFPKLLNNQDISLEHLKNIGYLLHFNTGLEIWKKNKIFGNGLKSFRLKCSISNYQVCNTHPHNYFIELMAETGILGLILIYTIFLLALNDFFKHYYYEKNINNKLISSTIFLLIFFEFFPLRSTGSFFTTSNSIYIFLLLSIFINLRKISEK